MKYYALTVLLLGALYFFANPAPSEQGFFFMASNSLPELARHAFFFLFAASVMLTQYAAGKAMDRQKAFTFSLLLLCPFFLAPALFVEQPMAVVSLFFASLATVAFIHIPIAAVVPVFLALYASPLSLLTLAIPIKRYLEGKKIIELIPLLGAAGLIFSYPSFAPSLAGVPLAAYGLAGFTSLFSLAFALLCFIFPASLPALALFPVEYKHKDQNAVLGAIGFSMLMFGEASISIAALSALMFFIILRFSSLDAMHLFFLFAIFTAAMLAASPAIMGIDVPEHELLEIFAEYKPDMIVGYPGAYKFYAGKDADVVDVTSPPKGGSIAISIESLRKAKPRNVMFLFRDDTESSIRFYYNDYYLYIVKYSGDLASDADVYTAGGKAFVGKASMTKLLSLFNGRVLVDANGFEESAIVRIAGMQPVACKEHACVYQLTS
ncbi:MAG: hypothetical protein QW035_01110 [Candidatus Anstonellales archaeon]